jgi:hypothetical protein
METVQIGLNFFDAEDQHALLYAQILRKGQKGNRRPERFRPFFMCARYGEQPGGESPLH